MSMIDVRLTLKMIAIHRRGTPQNLLLDSLCIIILYGELLQTQTPVFQEQKYLHDHLHMHLHAILIN